jgi:S-layer protein
VANQISQNLIQNLYVAYYGRPADANGMNYWAYLLEASGGNVGNLVPAFANSPEATALYGATPSATTLITEAYENILHRAPDPAGLAFYSNAVSTGQIALANLPLAVFQGVQSGGQDAALLQNELTAANLFTAEATNYGGSAAAAIGRTFLTQVSGDPNAQESLLGQLPSYISNASVATLGGSSGTTTSIPGGLTYTLTKGVDNITLTGDNNVVNGTVHSSSTPSPDTFTVGDTISGTGTGNVLNLTDLRTGATWTALGVAGITVSGIQTLNLSSGEPTAVNTVTTIEGFAGLTALNVSDVGGSALVAANTTAITLVDAAAAGATESVRGGSSVTLTANNVTAGGTISVGTVTAPTGAVVITLNEAPSQAGFVMADVINVQGGTTVTVTANLAGAAGVSNTVTGGVVSVTGTSATTSVTVNQTAAATASATVAGVVDGSVNINDINAGSATLAGTITNVSLANYGAGSTINDNGLTTLTLAGNGGALTLTDALTVPTATTLALNVNGLNATSFNDAHNEITTLNVVTGGVTASTIGTVTDAGLTTLNVSGTQQLTIGGTASASLTSVAVSGGAGVNVVLGTAASFVSTSTGTDVVTIAAAATHALTGNGTANEELVWNGAVAPAAAAYLGTETGFHVLGIGSAVTAGENFDMSTIAGFTGFDVQANTQTGTVQVLNAAAGSHLAIDGAFAGTLLYATADTAGPTDSLALTLGGSTVSGFTVTGLTLQDSTPNGIGNVSITSTTSTGLGTVNTISSFQDTSLTSLNLAGNAGLTIGSNLATNAASLTINGTSTGTAGIVFGGGITDTNLHTLTLTGTDSLSLGTVREGTTGITVSGATDNANISLALAGVTSTGHADIVTLGNGNNVVTDTAAAAGSTATISLGNGNNVVTVGATATNTVGVGTGHNTIIEAAGGNVAVTFGGHSAVTVDNVIAGAATTATIAPSAVVTGFNENGADTITFSGDAGATGPIVNVTMAQLNTFGSNPTTLAGAIAGVLAAGGGNLAQHAIAEFQFQNNTYFVEQAGATGSAFAAGDTVVELIGLHTFTTNTTAGSGVLHLQA